MAFNLLQARIARLKEQEAEAAKLKESAKVAEPESAKVAEPESAKVAEPESAKATVPAENLAKKVVARKPKSKSK